MNIKLTILALCAAAGLQIHGQTTNVASQLIIVELDSGGAVTRSNVMAFNLNSREVGGLNVNWEKDKSMVVQSNAVLLAQGLPTNSFPTFRKSAQDWVQSEFKKLGAQNDADERRKSAIVLIDSSFDYWWSQMTPAEKQVWKDASSAMATKYGSGQ
jgi:hypothetical protein